MPGHVVQFMPAAAHSDSSAAKRAAKTAIGEMLPRFWGLGQKLASAKNALLDGSEISEQEFADAHGVFAPANLPLRSSTTVMCPHFRWQERPMRS